jgi:segregation and condensation protein B
MDYFGINSPEDLPKIKEVISTDIIDPTAVQSDTLHVAGEEEQLLNSNETLVVTEDGELLEQPIAEETVVEAAEVMEEEQANEETAEAEEMEEEETETAEEQTEEEESNDEQPNDEEETK